MYGKCFRRDDHNHLCGCQRFKPSKEDSETCKVCDHDDGWHEGPNPGPDAKQQSELQAGLGRAPEMAVGTLVGMAVPGAMDMTMLITPSLERGFCIDKEEGAAGVSNAGAIAASCTTEQLDFGQLPDNFEPLASNQGLPGEVGEFQDREHLLPRREVEAGNKEAELRESETDMGAGESDWREERMGHRREGMELMLKGGEPAEEHLGSAAREDPQGMGNAGVPEPPTATKKRLRMLRELESRLKDTEDTVPFSQGQGQEDQTTSPISKRGRRTPYQWWRNQNGALCSYSEEKAPGKRRKGAKASKSPGQQSSNAAVPDAQRCNRNDGRNWRCSNERAPGRKVCEDHRQSRKKPSARKAGIAGKKGRGRSVTDAGKGSEEGQADGKAPSGVGGSRSGVNGEKGKELEEGEDLDGLPSLEEDAPKGKAVGAGASDFGFGATETVPRVDESGSKGPPENETPGEGLRRQERGMEIGEAGRGQA